MGQCKKVKLIVTVWLCISPKKICREQEAKKDFQVSHLVQLRKKIVQQKTLTKELTVINPPALAVRHVTAGDKQLLLCQVHNSTSYTLQLHGVCILPNRGAGNAGDVDGRLGTTNEKCECSPVVPLSQISYPVHLLSGEKLSCVFHLTAPYVEADAVPVDLLLKAHLNWSQKKDIEVVTLYSLPTLKVRRAPFTVSVVCKEEPNIGEK
ncbi:uncharacterized protein LOC121368477 [Gigantopelta aegis]|uniref:uncharacterized protein LOC121368477 n=1 Tax=Gigantopelta aegis TaxID=1735272 RepID=UPI001B88B5DE|nr:uncharacterized protein LOC121368477 [Gigantopelta aegis]